jgi:hypothetical protein
MKPPVVMGQSPPPKPAAGADDPHADEPKGPKSPELAHVERPKSTARKKKPTTKKAFSAAADAKRDNDEQARALFRERLSTHTWAAYSSTLGAIGTFEKENDFRVTGRAIHNSLTAQSLADKWKNEEAIHAVWSVIRAADAQNNQLFKGLIAQQEMNQELLQAINDKSDAPPHDKLAEMYALKGKMMLTSGALPSGVREANPENARVIEWNLALIYGIAYERTVILMDDISERSSFSSYYPPNVENPLSNPILIHRSPNAKAEARQWFVITGPGAPHKASAEQQQAGSPVKEPPPSPVVGQTGGKVGAAAAAAAVVAGAKPIPYSKAAAEAFFKDNNHPWTDPTENIWAALGTHTGMTFDNMHESIINDIRTNPEKWKEKDNLTRIERFCINHIKR